MSTRKFLPGVLLATAAFLFGQLTARAQQDLAVVTRHALQLNGQARVEGSVQQLLGENATLDGGAVVTSDLLVPGTPTVRLHGGPTFDGTIVGTGSAQPGGYEVTLNGGSSLRNLRTRTDPAALPTVSAPPGPAGTRKVTLNQAGQSVGDWATLRDLTLNGNAGAVAVPPGTYGKFTANAQSGFVLGVAGAAQPAVYHFQSWTLNGQSTVQVVGPVIVTLGAGFNANGQTGVAAHPEWLQLRLASGGVTLNGGSTLHGAIVAPGGTVIINGQAALYGTAACDRFTLNGGGLVSWRNTTQGMGNRPPVAAPQNLTTPEDLGLAITLAGSDPDGNSLGYAITAPPSRGTLSGTAPNVTYTPDTDYFGADSFAFTVHDGTAVSAPAVVVIDIQPRNDVPVANSGALLVTEDTATIITLTASDVDGDALTFAVPPQTLRGRVEKTTSPGAGAGDFIYFPGADSTQPDSFFFTANDGHGGTAQAVIAVTITTVDDRPRAGALDLTMPEDGTLPLTLVGIDPDGELLTFEFVRAPDRGVVEGAGTDFAYRPAANFLGDDSFEYVAIDTSGDRSAPALVTLHVAPVDDAPTAQAEPIATPEDVAVTVAVTAEDVEDEALGYEILVPPQHGLLSGAGPMFVYTPGRDFFGSDSFTFRARDQADPDALASAPVTVAITVESRNDAPVAHAQAIGTTEDTPVTITLAGSDVDGDALTFVVPRPPEEGQSFGPEHGTLAPTEDPRVWIYTPAANYDRDDRFVFRVTDSGGATADAVVSIVMTPANDLPNAVPLALETREDAPLSLTLTGVDVDDAQLEFDPLEATGPLHGALAGTSPTFLYTPAADFFGDDRFDYVAIDSAFFGSDPARVSIVVLPVNDRPVAPDLPVATNEDTPVEIHLAATDAENDPLTYAVLSDPAHGVLEALGPGHYRFHPSPNFHGPDSLVFVANDGLEDSLPATVRLTVRPVNDAPVALAASFATAEDTALSVVLTATDVDGDTLTFLDPSDPPHGTLTRDPNEPNRFTYTPDPDFHGPDSFTFVVNDGQAASAPVLTSITVAPVNDPPTVSAGADLALTAPAPITLAGGFTDDGDAVPLVFQWEKVSGPGNVTFAAAAAAQTTAAYSAAGTYVLRLTVSDGEFSASDELEVVLAMPNRPPLVVAGPAQHLAAGQPATLAGTVTDDGLPLNTAVTQQWTKVGGPGAVTFADATSGATTATFSAPGEYVLRLRATDTLLTAQAETVVTVAAPNAAPTVHSGADLTAGQGALAQLAGSVTDDGLPRGAGLQIQWSKVSGPGVVTFGDPFSAATSAHFSAAGLYTLMLAAHDGELTGRDEVQIAVIAAANAPPAVEAGPDQTITGSRATLLQGRVTDDGLPSNASLVPTWSKVSGPGTVTFAETQRAASGVSFGVGGTYVLRLSATDGELAASDEVRIEVQVQNSAPTVTIAAGPPALPATPKTLRGSAVDDGLPQTPLTFQWSKVSGPGEVVFAAPTTATTVATFAHPGDYVLQLVANDGELTGQATVTVSVGAGENLPPQIALTTPVTDAEFGLGDVIQITAAASDPDGAVQRVEFYADGIKIGEDFDAPYALLWAGATDGEHCLVAVATDDLGGQTSSDPGTAVVSVALSGLRWELPNTGFLNPQNCYCPLVVTDATELEGTPGVLYELDVRFRGVVEKCTYLGGSHRGTTWQIGGLPDNSGFNVYKLEVSDPPQVYYLNRGASHDPEIYLIDFVETIQARGGATITLTADSVNGIEHSNYRNFVVPGVAPAPLPFDGQFVQMDVVSARSSQATIVRVRPPCASPPPGLVAWWPGQGNADDFLEAHPGTLLGTGSYAAGRVGQGFLFNASGDRVRIPAAPALNVGAGAGVTVECWIKPGSVASAMPLVEWNNESGSFGAHLWVSETFGGGGVGSLFLNLADTSGANRLLITPPGAILSDRLQHVAATYDRASGVARIFVDGAMVAQQTLGSFTPRTSSAFWIGNRPSGPQAGTSFRGVIDEVALYDRALTPAQVSAIRSAGSAGKCRPTDNHAPTVFAGPDLATTVGSPASLQGRVEDDGYPLRAGLSASWSVVSGPGSVTFATAANPATAASFSAVGPYVLRLTATDTDLAASDDVLVFVEASGSPNAAPVVGAGADRSVTFPQLASLAATVTDDGQPGAALAVLWTKVSGPGTVTFADAESASTSAAFSFPGTYVLRITASDSQLAGEDELTVLVAASGVNLSPVVNAGSDLTLRQNEQTLLGGTVTDDGVPTAPPSLHWSKVSGPGSVSFSSPGSASSAAGFSAVGTYVLRLGASDSQKSAADDVTVTVLPPGNERPTISAGPDRTVAVGQPLVITPEVDDDGLPSGGVSVLWSIVSGPGPAELSAADAGGISGRFSRVGVFVLRLTVEDGELSATDDVRVTVTPVATVPPLVQLTAPGHGETRPQGQPLVLSATASDPDVAGGIVSVDFYAGSMLLGTDSAPDATGAVRFSWTGATVGPHTLTAIATDVSGTTATSAPLAITITPASPKVALTYPVAYRAFAPGESVQLQATASPALGGAEIAQVEFLVNGRVAGIDPGAPFAAGWTAPAAPGDYTLTARATNAAGQTATSPPVLIRVAVDPAAPTVVEITAPESGGSITAPVAVTGTVDGPIVASYTLEYRQRGACGEWVRFASGAQRVVDGVLGTLDPTLLLNGLYEIRLTGREAGGGVVAVVHDVVVHGDMKVGEMTFSAQDLSIQLPGLSLDITRTYHSTNPCADDFGPGWDLDINAVRLFKNAALGDQWFYDIFIPANFFVPPSYTLADGGPHIVAIVFPNGETYRFRPILALKNPRTTAFTEPYGNAIGQTFVPFTYADRFKIAYQPLPGAEGIKLVPRGYRAVDPWTYTAQTVPGDADFFLGDTANGAISLAIFENTAQDAPLVEDATAFDLVMPDGRTFSFGADGRLTRLTDRVGNWVEVRANGVFHSTGPAITWTRNAEGKITEVRDLRGGKIEYQYDGVGILTGVKDRVGNLTSYEYEPSSGKLKRILDASGLEQLGNEYDPNGRLFLQKSAASNALVRMVHNLTTRTEQLIDPLGKITTLTYDARGQVVESRDPLGAVTRFAYDEAGRRVAVENALGHVQHFAFEQGMRTIVFPGEGPGGSDRVEHQSEPLITKITDPEGAVFRYAYNAQSKPTQLIDALGRSVALSYDAAGNVASVTDPLGKTTSFSYNARGQITSRTDALGQTTSYEYNAAGRMSRIVDAMGHAASMTYDANGNEVTRTTTRTKSDGFVETLTTTFEYDANDRLVKTTDPLGRETRTIYDVNGRVTETTDPAGRSTKMFYDTAGRPIRTEAPDGTSTGTEYDLAGRVVKSFDALDRATRHEYDDAGRLVRTIAPDGAETVTTYDPAGRVIAATDALGRATEYSYDRVGRRTAVRDALGQETLFAYDANGNLASVEDALGHVTTYQYDALNRRIGTTFADATSATTAYDDLGRVIAETDQANRTKSYAYDALGRLLGVTDALGQMTAFTYDELGNQLTQVDALNRITRYSYDALGRRVRRTLPLGMFETLSYDDAGNLSARTDFKGRTTTYQYDAQDRLLAKVPDPALGDPTVSYTYTATGRRATMTDASGRTQYSYDNRDRLTGKATPQGTLTYQYNPAGQLTQIASEAPEGVRTNYSYDALGRLSTVGDVELGTTSYTYDALGNLSSFATPNGVTHSYGYDPLNRLTQMLVSAVPATGPPITRASYSYTLSATGRRDGVAESGPGILPANPSGTRSVTYFYDALDRLTRETIAAAPGPAGQTHYTYDAVGNRLTRTSTVPGLPSQSFGYDANDRLTAHTHDANGNTVLGQVPQPTASAVPVPTPAEASVIDSYDFEDRLKSRAGGGLTVQVLYDGDGHRVAETVNGQTTTHLIDELNPTGYAQVVEERTNGIVTRTYTYGHDLLAQDTRESTGQWRAEFFGYDGHGSVRFLTDELANITDTYSYDAFGTLLASSGTTANRYRYAGEEFAPALGLYHLRARYLNAAHGRFWTADTYEGQQTDPHSLHRYTYAYNNPANLRDPSGNTPTLASTMMKMALISGSIGAAIGTGDTLVQSRGNASGWELLCSAGSGFFMGAGVGVAAPAIAAASPLAAVGLGIGGVGAWGYSVYHAAAVENDGWLASYRALTGLFTGLGFSRVAAIRIAYQEYSAQVALALSPYLVAAEMRLQAVIFPLRPGTSIPAGPPAIIFAAQVTVLGENMAQRVKPFAERTGARTIPFGASADEWAAMTAQQRYKLNDGALRARINEGDSFRYIGQDPLRNPALRTQFDLTESELLRLNYRGIHYKTVSPSEVMFILGYP